MTEPDRRAIVSRGRRLALVTVVLCAVAASPTLPRVPATDGGAISRQGTYEGGRYLIEVPAGWNPSLRVRSRL